MTLYTSRNPSVRVSEYADTGEVLDSTQYTRVHTQACRLDLAALNRNASSPSALHWRVSYAVSKEYNMTSLSPRVFAGESVHRKACSRGLTKFLTFGGGLPA
eukprot:jgi/Chlat1/1921/Chrsp152S02234